MTRHPEWLVPGALLVMTACGGETPSLHEPVRLADRVFDQAALTPVTFQDETRFSVAPNVPSQMRFEIRVPMRGVLEFGTGARVADGAVLPARVEFRVELRSGDEREMVFSHTIRRFEPNAWFDHEIDLTRWEGSVVDLSFEVSALAPRGDRDGTPASVDGLTPLWANPVIFSREAPRDRPDVILVSIDCLRVDHVSTYGYARETTPWIDRFAKDGVVFETAVASAPETLPSHMSILTGLTPSAPWREQAFEASRERSLSSRASRIERIRGGRHRHGSVLVPGVRFRARFPLLSILGRAPLGGGGRRSATPIASRSRTEPVLVVASVRGSLALSS